MLTVVRLTNSSYTKKIAWTRSYTMLSTIYKHVYGLFVATLPLFCLVPKLLLRRLEYSSLKCFSVWTFVALVIQRQHSSTSLMALGTFLLLIPRTHTRMSKSECETFINTCRLPLYEFQDLNII